MSEHDVRRAVVLYGPPAAGKNTITSALTREDGQYRLFLRLKAGPGRTAGYRMVTVDQLDALRRVPGEIVWENQRYGAVYAVDRSGLVAMLDLGQVPVLHLGQVAAVAAVTSASPDVRWLVVALTCPRAVAAQRIVQRATGDTAARLAAFDATEMLPGADLTIDTSAVTPEQSATRIRALISTTNLPGRDVASDPRGHRADDGARRLDPKR